MRRLGSSLSLTTVLLTAGCSPAMLARESAEPIQCPEDQLEIVDAHQPMEGPSSWTAICRVPEREPSTWFCSRAGDAQRVICSYVPPAQPTS